ncbi:MAG: CotH kinase family protein [Aristaeellaceae bacterium]
MLKTKWMDRAACGVTALMLLASVLLWGITESGRGEVNRSIGYESRLFDQSVVHTIDIYMDDWDAFIANAVAEEYADCSIVIDGERMNHAAIRAKGNTSLSSVSALGSTRYSFKVEFDHFVSGMTYHGLDKLSLNNLIQDATMMKDYLAYTLMNRMDVPSPLCSYVQINVNGEPWGLYLAVEGVEDAFLERNGLTGGDLYKPDSISFGGGRGNGRDFDMDKFRTDDQTSQADAATGATAKADAPSDEGGSFSGSSGMPGGMPQMPDGDFAPSGGFSGFGDANPPDMDGGSARDGMPGGFSFGMGSDDVRLIYTDDNPDSYTNIFNNAKTKVSKRDQARLIESLRKLNAKEDIPSVVDTGEVTRYLAVHHFLCNDDSYTGMMVHNYYLYERDGQLSIIPWDYNLGFGGFSASADATSTVNSPIDSPVSGGTTESRPLIAWIFDDEEALAGYHETYSRFIAETVENGWLAEEISRVQTMITPYLEQDTSAFYDMAEFEKAVETLQAFCARRGESIRGQLEGKIPSTTQAQQQNRSALVDASDISTADMGSMNSTKGGGFAMRGGFGNAGGNDAAAPGNAGRPDSGGFSMPEGMSPPTGGAGQNPPGDMGASSGGTSAAAPSTEAPGIPSASPGGPEQMPSAGFTRADAAPQDQSGQWLQLALWAAVLLAAAFIIHRADAHNH